MRGKYEEVKKRGTYPTSEQQDELIVWMGSAPVAEVRAALHDSEFRYVMNETFQAWRMRTQIRAMRVARGWTQKELGERVGMAQSAIARLETMYAPVDVQIRTLRRIARAFDVRLKIGFAGWLSLVGEIFNMGCRQHPRSFTEDFSPL